MSKRVGGGAAKRAGIPLAGQDVVERIGVIGEGREHRGRGREWS